MTTYQRDFPSELRALGLTLRLRRLADRMSHDARKVYRELGLDIEPGWHAALLLLYEGASLSVSEIARALGVSHPTACSLLDQLRDRGYVKDLRDPDDRRRRLVRLSARARRVIPTLSRTWEAYDTALQGIIKETDRDVLETVRELEEALGRRSLDERVMDSL